jgi:hypothetical protein
MSGTNGIEAGFFTQQTGVAISEKLPPLEVSVLLVDDIKFGGGHLVLRIVDEKDRCTHAHKFTLAGMKRLRALLDVAISESEQS